MLSGATTVPMLQSNLSARELTVPDGLLASLLALALALNPAEYWHERSALPWN